MRASPDLFRWNALHGRNLNDPYGRFFIQLALLWLRKSLKGWSRHSCLLTYFRPKSLNPVSGNPTIRRRLPHWKKDGAIYWITFRLDDAIPRGKRRGLQNARMLRIKNRQGYWLHKGGASRFSVCITTEGR